MYVSMYIDIGRYICTDMYVTHTYYTYDYLHCVLKKQCDSCLIYNLYKNCRLIYAIKICLLCDLFFKYASNGFYMPKG